MTKSSKGKRLNIYFRQTAKEFKSARQTQVYSHIKRNLPYRIFSFTKERIIFIVEKARNVSKSVTKLPTSAKRIK